MVSNFTPARARPWLSVPCVIDAGAPHYGMYRAYQLGVKYAEGRHFPFDHILARRWLTEATMLGHPSAEEALHRLAAKLASLRLNTAPWPVPPPADASAAPEAPPAAKPARRRRPVQEEPRQPTRRPRPSTEQDAGPVLPLAFADPIEKRVFALGFRSGLKMFERRMRWVMKRYGAGGPASLEFVVFDIKSRCLARADDQYVANLRLERLQEYVTARGLMSTYVGTFETLASWMYEGLQSGIEKADRCFDGDLIERDTSAIIADACSVGLRSTAGLIRRERRRPPHCDAASAMTGVAA